jgi:hypothetical protein
MRDVRGGREAVGDALRAAYKGAPVTPLPPDMAALLGRIDAAEAKDKRHVR